MRSETAYEVYSYGDRRWMMEARFAAEAKNDAYLLANELRRQPGIETVRIVREIWDPRTNGFSEVTIYEVRGPGRDRAGGVRRPAFGTMLPSDRRLNGPVPHQPAAGDPTLRILGRVLIVVAIACVLAAAATMTAQAFWPLTNDARIGVFAAVLLVSAGIGLASAVSRSDWEALIADAPAGPQPAAAAPPPLRRNAADSPLSPEGAADLPSPASAEASAASSATPSPEPLPESPSEPSSESSSDRQVRAEVRMLDFLQQSLADPRLGPEERSSFQTFVFTIGAVDALAREDSLDRPARFALLETCGVALGIDSATVAHTLENLARTVSRSDGLALAQAGMRAMLDRLGGLPFANGLADALAAQQAQKEGPRPAPAHGGVSLAIGLSGLDQPNMRETRKRITDMVDYHRGFATIFRPDSASANFMRHTEALIAALALAAVLQPLGGTRGRPRFGLGNTLAGAAAAIAAAEPGEIVADADFDSAIRMGLGEDLPPGYRPLAAAPGAEAATEEDQPLPKEIVRRAGR